MSKTYDFISRPLTVNSQTSDCEQCVVLLVCSHATVCSALSKYIMREARSGVKRCNTRLSVMQQLTNTCIIVLCLLKHSHEILCRWHPI